MYVKPAVRLGQFAGKQDEHLLSQILRNGLRFHAEIEGSSHDILLSPEVLRSPYIPKNHPESQEYWSLPQAERAKVAATVSRIFKEATGIVRNLNPKDPRDKPWIRIWLILRDIVMRARAKAKMPTPKTRVWYTEPLPPSEFHRFEKAIKDLESKVLTTQDPRRSRFLCWIEKLKKPDVDDRIIKWSKICPITSGAIGAAMLVGPCDLTQGTPVDQATLEKSILSVNDIEKANKFLGFITHMRSDIVVSHEMTSFPLENFRTQTDQARLAIKKLNLWANNPMGGSSAMPYAYRAIKDWIIKQRNNPRSLYSCL